MSKTEAEAQIVKTKLRILKANKASVKMKQLIQTTTCNIITEVLWWASHNKSSTVAITIILLCNTSINIIKGQSYVESEEQ